MGGDGRYNLGMSSAPRYVYTNTQQPFRFRIVHLLYIMGVLGSSAATFGPWGLFAGALVVGFWSIVYLSDSRPRGLAIAAGFALILCCFCCLLLPAVSSAREAARRMSCSSNLKQIGLALHNYHDTHGRFPPAWLAGENGKPMHSWRVLILPYIESSDLYAQYDFNEPWNGPNNSKLASRMPRSYLCPSHDDSAPYCSYHVVTGPAASFRGAEPRDLGEFTNGTHRTVLSMEDSSRRVHWMEPRDITYEQALAAFQYDLGSTHRRQDFFWEYYGGRNVLMADGSVHFLYGPLPLKSVEGLLNVQREQQGPVDVRSLYTSSKSSRRLRVGNCVRLAVFSLFALWPLPWVWIGGGGAPKAAP